MHTKLNSIHFQRRIAQFLFFASPFTLPYMAIIQSISLNTVDSPEKLNFANLFGLIYVIKLFLAGIPFLLFGIIPIILGTVLLVFYRVQSNRKTKRAAWGWLGSIIFNLIGPIAIVTAAFDRYPWWSIEMPIYLWATLNVVLSSLALWYCLTEC